jgi:hypothetical protein
MITSDVTNDTLEKIMIDKILDDIIMGKRSIKELISEVILPLKHFTSLGYFE